MSILFVLFRDTLKTEKHYPVDQELTVLMYSFVLIVNLKKYWWHNEAKIWSDEKKINARKKAKQKAKKLTNEKNVKVALVERDWMSVSSSRTERKASWRGSTHLHLGMEVPGINAQKLIEGRCLRQRPSVNFLVSFY